MDNPRRLIDYHRSLLADKVRTESYQKAIFETVKDDDVVLDIGTGTGILSLFACQAGAKKVYAIEVGKVVELAKHICLQNGFQNRITFINELSSRVKLSEQVDVIVSEIMGNFGLEEGVLSSVIDARERFLKEKGKIIPESIELFIVPVELPDDYQKKFNFWKDNLYGLDLSSVRLFATNHFYPIKLKQESFLAEPISLARIKISEVETQDICSEISLTVKRDGVLHGLGGWFAAMLSNNISLSNVPPIKTPSWNQAFFPLKSPVHLKQGNSLIVKILTYNGAEWRWQVEIESKSYSGETLQEQKTKFDHSTFWGFPLSREEFRKQALNYTPKLSRKGEAELFLLNLFNGKSTISEMTSELFRCFPDYFKSLKEASNFVRETVSKCG